MPQSRLTNLFSSSMLQKALYNKADFFGIIASSICEILPSCFFSFHQKGTNLCNTDTPKWNRHFPQTQAEIALGTHVYCARNFCTWFEVGIHDLSANSSDHCLEAAALHGIITSAAKMQLVYSITATRSRCPERSRNLLSPLVPFGQPVAPLLRFRLNINILISLIDMVLNKR